MAAPNHSFLYARLSPEALLRITMICLQSSISTFLPASGRKKANKGLIIIMAALGCSKFQT